MRMKTSFYRSVSLTLALIFAAVGLLFLLQPDAVFQFMNGLGHGFDLTEAPLPGAGFYPGLAVGYMYVVTILAWMMFRSPSIRVLPLLLAHAKGASSLVSFGLFVFHQHAFIYLANGLVDLLLGALAFGLYRIRKKTEATSF
jgi:hypothetical protein